VDLPERLEDLRRPLLGDADAGVAHLNGDFGVPVRGYRRLHRDFNAAGGGELHRIVDQTAKQLAQSRGVAHHHVGKRRPRTTDQEQALLTRSGGEFPRRSLHHRAQIKFRLFQAEVAGGQRRILQRRVQDAQQLLGADARGGDVFPLLFVQIGFQQQVGHAHDAAERGTDFVIQAGEKLLFEGGQTRVLSRYGTAEQV